jgi:hypothetical protein
MITTALLLLLGTGTTMTVPPILDESPAVLRAQYEQECRKELGYSSDQKLIAVHLFTFRRCVVKKDAAAHRLKTMQDRTTRVQDIYGNSRNRASLLRENVEKRFLRERKLQMRRQVMPDAHLTTQQRSDKLKTHRANLREKRRQVEQGIFDEAQ